MLPERFVARMRTLLDAEAEALLDALARRADVGLRVNTLKLAPQDFAALSGWPLAPLPWAPQGFVIGDSALRPGAHPYHAAGLYYLQEPSAMSVAEVLGAKPGERVIDLAAAPGGKTTQLAALMHNQGLLIANDTSASRARAIVENLERLGVSNAVVTSSEIAALAARWPGLFDRVLLDAPCSGEGMFRKNAEARAMWSEANIARCALRQAQLLAEAAKLVRSGGVLVYSTCTFALEENEARIAAFLEAHPEFVLETITLPGTRPGFSLADSPIDTTRTARLWPHLAPGEGHFIARLRRLDGETGRLVPMRYPPPAAAVQRQWLELSGELGIPPTGELTQLGQQLYAVPDGVPELRGLKVLRSGLWLATAHKQHLTPSHSLALAIPPERAQTMNHLPLTPQDPRLARYLAGEVLEASGARGYVLITLAGYPLGWGKRAHGVINNLYPKGLRRQA